MVRISEIVNWIDSVAPFRYAQSWDNSGLQVGNPDAAADRILVALDPGSEVIAEAESLKCQCLVTHHPLLLRPVRSIVMNTWPGNIIARAILSGIGIVAAHTNLDAAVDGTNTQLGDLMGITDFEPLEVEAGFADQAGYNGIGLVGSLPESVALGVLARNLRDLFGGADVRMVGDPGKGVSRAAICTGSGGGLIGKVASTGADVYITGDVKYHDAKLALESGLAVLDIGHFASEKLVLEPLAAFLESKSKEKGASLEIFVSKSEKDPFRIVTGNC